MRDLVTAIADAVLYEGYLLYPYRASATKNRMRWQWGVLMPPSFTTGGEHPDSHADLLVVGGMNARLHVRLRFLQLQARVVEVDHRAVPSAVVAGREYTTWDEAVEREVDVELPLGSSGCFPFEIEGGEDVEPVSGAVRLVRRRSALSGSLTLHAAVVPPGLLRLRLDVRNTSVWTRPDADRDAAVHHALIAAHTLLSVSEGEFVSLLDPPEWAAEAVAHCRSERTWPVLMGRPGRSDTVLCAPIILYDHPQIAEQSPGDMFDGTEIDELLTLRTRTLTDEEKRQARATDARAAELLDRVEGLPAASLEALHGTMRREEPGPRGAGGPGDGAVAGEGSGPVADRVLVDGAEVGEGSGPVFGRGLVDGAVAGEGSGLVADRVFIDGVVAGKACGLVADHVFVDGVEVGEGCGPVADRVFIDGAVAGEGSCPVSDRGLVDGAVAGEGCGPVFDRGLVDGAVAGEGCGLVSDRGLVDGAVVGEGCGPIPDRVLIGGAEVGEGSGPIPDRVPINGAVAGEGSGPIPDHVLINGAEIGRGSKVRLRPSSGADAQDMFLAGRIAQVHALRSDVDGGVHLAVTLEDDEGADLLADFGLYRYFAPDEVEPL
ncbi:MAG TPA: hypothetical protein VF821_30895 [Lentzea sp.]